MANIKFAGESYACAPGESVLECLTRNGAPIPSSCKAGVCQTCLMKSIEGSVPEAAQAGLKPTLQRQGYFLACICKPETDLSVAVSDDDVRRCHTATVVEKQLLAPNILRLRLRTKKPIHWRPGQFMNLLREDGLGRSYSIASLPGEGVLEFHIERIDRGRMSNWLHDDVTEGSSLEVEGPHGECYYLDGNPDQTLVLIGTGTGLAPLYGIARDALEQGHDGPIHLFHGSRHADKLYLGDELRTLAEQHSNFHYTPCLSGADVPAGVQPGRANDVALAQLGKLDGMRLFLCGNPDMVNMTKRSAFLAGASLQEIYADPFTLSS